MTTKDFKIWLVEHNYNQKIVAQQFGLTEATISNYVTNNRFPRWFKFALRGLERC